jgi:CubicO group peptidase (beta-lactamase class C family)
MDAGYKWTGLDAARLDRIGGLLEREYLATGRLIGCDVAVARHGHIAYRRTFGLMDRERAAPVREDTLWRIYSMTKPVASVALMMLFERGLFQLNDPVCDWVPSWRDQRVWVSGQGEAMVTEPVARPVSFRDLLSHTAGLGYSGAFAPRDAPHPIDLAYRAAAVQTIGSPDSATVLLDKLGPLPLRFQPGSAWHYSAATDVCGALVELISGQPLGDFLEAEIFAPLGMKDTSFCVPPEKRDRFAANYRRLEDGALALFDDPGASPYCQPPAFHSGGGGLVSTTADYLRFCEMLRRGGELDGSRRAWGLASASP